MGSGMRLVKTIVKGIERANREANRVAAKRQREEERLERQRIRDDQRYLKEEERRRKQQVKEAEKTRKLNLKKSVGGEERVAEKRWKERTQLRLEFLNRL